MTTFTVYRETKPGVAELVAIFASRVFADSFALLLNVSRKKGGVWYVVVEKEGMPR